MSTSLKDQRIRKEHIMSHFRVAPDVFKQTKSEKKGVKIECTLYQIQHVFASKNPIHLLQQKSVFHLQQIFGSAKI